MLFVPVIARRQTHLAARALRVVAAAGLAVDAAVHVDLAPIYSGVGGSITEGDLFLAEAVVACVAALLVLFVGGRLVPALVLVVAVSALAALFVSRFVDIGSIGPLPNLYEPAWYLQKTQAAVGEIVAIVASLALLLQPFAAERKS